jgi:hypothetical protein
MFPCPVGTYPEGIKGHPQRGREVQFQHSPSLQYSDAEILQYSSTPSPRVAGFEHEHEHEHEAVSAERQTP